MFVTVIFTTVTLYALTSTSRGVYSIAAFCALNRDILYSSILCTCSGVCYTSILCTLCLQGCSLKTPCMWRHTRNQRHYGSETKASHWCNKSTVHSYESVLVITPVSCLCLTPQIALFCTWAVVRKRSVAALYTLTVACYSNILCTYSGTRTRRIIGIQDTNIKCRQSRI